MVICQSIPKANPPYSLSETAFENSTKNLLRYPAPFSQLAHQNRLNCSSDHIQFKQIKEKYVRQVINELLEVHSLQLGSSPPPTPHCWIAVLILYYVKPLMVSEG